MTNRERRFLGRARRSYFLLNIYNRFAATRGPAATRFTGDIFSSEVLFLILPLRQTGPLTSTAWFTKAKHARQAAAAKTFFSHKHGAVFFAKILEQLRRVLHQAHIRCHRLPSLNMHNYGNARRKELMLKRRASLVAVPYSGSLEKLSVSKFPAWAGGGWRGASVACVG